MWVVFILSFIYLFWVIFFFVYRLLIIGFMVGNFVYDIDIRGVVGFIYVKLVK